MLWVISEFPLAFANVNLHTLVDLVAKPGLLRQDFDFVYDTPDDTKTLGRGWSSDVLEDQPQSEAKERNDKEILEPDEAAIVGHDANDIRRYPRFDRYSRFPVKISSADR